VPNEYKGYGKQGYSGRPSVTGKFRMEIDMHLGSLEIEQDTTFHTIH
jgi:hypothetical protein